MSCPSSLVREAAFSILSWYVSRQIRMLSFISSKQNVFQFKLSRSHVLPPYHLRGYLKPILSITSEGSIETEVYLDPAITTQFLQTTETEMV